MHRTLSIAAAVLALLARRKCSRNESAREARGQLLKGQVAFGGWQQDRPGRKAALYAAGFAVHRRIDAELQ